MTMSHPMKIAPSIALRTLVLLVVSTGFGVVYGGLNFGLGVLASAALMIGSMGMSWLAMRRAMAARALGATVAVASLPFLLKVPMLGGAAWLLLQHFPPLSVALGGCVLVGAITLHAVADSAGALREA